MTGSPRRRPRWAEAVDRLALALARGFGALLGRPSEDLLAELARRDRPGLRGHDDAGYPSAGAEAHIAAGRAAFAAGQHAEALFRFGQALEAAPGAAWAWHGRGDALQLLGQPSAALDAYDRAVALAPGTGLHHAGRANALTALGRAEEAELAFKEALALDSSLMWMRSPRSGG